MKKVQTIQVAACAAVLACAMSHSSAFAQDGSRRQIQQQQPQPQVIIRGNGVVVIDGAEIVIRQQVMPNTLLIPSDEELLAVPVSDEVRRLVALLDSDDYTEREQAMQSLITTRESNRQLYAVLAGSEGPLSVEQRQRVLGALIERLINTPRGALGIRMDTGGPGREVNEVRIVDLIPGLPAERVLRIGDRITHIDDQPISLADDLISLVQSRRPGESVNLTVLRPNLPGQEPGDTKLHLSVELGSSELLVDPLSGMPTSSRFDATRRAEASTAELRFGPRTRELTLRRR
ncbi:MAG TPA: PDZ domain-containing protein [Phycisphaerales bacterium]|nr:PDZ domain-containing protein [Phycisphaerales bacterium]HRQ75954.1 PDZ domain-containing protein [Phycisphaerales bacterium]